MVFDILANADLKDRSSRNENALGPRELKDCMNRERSLLSMCAWHSGLCSWSSQVLILGIGFRFSDLDDEIEWFAMANGWFTLTLP